jgi:hypothetical protein
MESENQTNIETKQEEMSPWQMIIGIIAILGMSFWIWNSFIKGESGGNVTKTSSVEMEQEEVKTYSDYDAYVNAQMILEKFLKSPSTAEYPVASKATIERYNDDAFKVSAYVDSQNGFGATLRSEWIVFLQFVGDSVKPLGVVVDGETLYREPDSE